MINPCTVIADADAGAFTCGNHAANLLDEAKFSQPTEFHLEPKITLSKERGISLEAKGGWERAALWELCATGDFDRRYFFEARW